MKFKFKLIKTVVVVLACYTSGFVMGHSYNPTEWTPGTAVFTSFVLLVWLNAIWAKEKENDFSIVLKSLSLKGLMDLKWSLVHSTRGLKRDSEEYRYTQEKIKEVKELIASRRDEIGENFQHTPPPPPPFNKPGEESVSGADDKN